MNWGQNDGVTFAYMRRADARQFIGSDRARIRDLIFTAKMKGVHVQPESHAIEYIIRP